MLFVLIFLLLSVLYVHFFFPRPLQLLNTVALNSLCFMSQISAQSCEELGDKGNGHWGF